MVNTNRGKDGYCTICGDNVDAGNHEICRAVARSDTRCHNIIEVDFPEPNNTTAVEFPKPAADSRRPMLVLVSPKGSREVIGTLHSDDAALKLMKALRLAKQAAFHMARSGL